MRWWRACSAAPIAANERPAPCTGPLRQTPPARGFPPARQCQYHEGRASPSARPMARIEMSDNDRRGGEGPGTGVIVKAKPKTKKPSMYKVLMLNDDYTPMEFVVHTLERFFQKNR